MTKRTPPRPVQRTAGATIQELLTASDRVSPAYVTGDGALGSVAGPSWGGRTAGHALVDEDDPDRVSNLCDVGAHAWCDGSRCACGCHRETWSDDEPA